MIIKKQITILKIKKTKAFLKLSDFQKYTCFEWNEKHMAQHISDLMTVVRYKGLNHVLDIYHVSKSVFKTNLIKELNDSKI